MKIEITKTGKDFTSTMQMLEKKMLKTNAESMAKMGVKLLEKSIPVTPIDKGDLRESGYVNVNDKQIAKGTQNGVERSGSVSNDTNDKIYVDVGYNTPYALRQHEEFPVKRTQGTQWKYLENPLKQNIGEFMTELENDVKKVIK